MAKRNPIEIPREHTILIFTMFLMERERVRDDYTEDGFGELVGFIGQVGDELADQADGKDWGSGKSHAEVLTDIADLVAVLPDTYRKLSREAISLIVRRCCFP